MAPFLGFVGGSYTALAQGADAERSINLYPERVQSAGGAAKSGGFILYSKPGLKAFVTLPGCTAVTDVCELNGRVFALGKSGANTLLFEVFQNGTATQRGSTLPGDARGQLCPGEVEVLLLLAGNGYIFNLAANTVTRITAQAFPQGATKAAFLDGYFAVVEPNSQLFAISGLNSGLSWDALDFEAVNGAPGNVVSLMSMYRQLWFLCVNRGEVYYDSGNADFPFTRLENGIFEQGTAAIDSPAKFDNTLMWLGKNADGAGIVWRADGYIPRRASTHAIETLIDSYGTISDARGYTYQEKGHTFYVLHFPSAQGGLGATLVYDVSSGFWHERGSWDATLGAYRGDLARSHAFAWGMHLVGDYRSGKIYRQSMLYATDDGAEIRRLRAAPDLARGGKWTFYHALCLQCQAGVGLDSIPAPVPQPQPLPPQP